MYIEDSIKDFYKVLSGVKRCLVLVNYDIDGICACKILHHLFRCDNIEYTLVPVQGMKELIEAYEKHLNEVKFVVLINCGGTIDLVLTLELERNEDVVFFVIDSHRPTDVCNVYSKSQIRLLAKSNENEKVPDFEEIFSDDESEEEEADSGESDGEDRQTKRQRLAEERILKRRDKRIWQEKRNKLMFDYSQFTYYSNSSALMMFELAWRLSKDNNDLLWWSIVGVTEQLILGKADSTDYVVETGNIQAQVSRLNYRAEEAEELEATSVKISFNKELRLALYRHWSVESSLRHSAYPACQLKMWTLRGEKKLQKMLAEMGLPLTQARQKFSAMDLAMRNEFFAMMEKVMNTEEYKLSDLSYPSFLLRHGYRHRLSPADYVYAMLALLEHSDPDRAARECFLAALDCLSRANTAILDEGIERAKKMLVLVFKQVRSLMDLRQVVSAGPFVYVVLQEGSLDGRMFAKPHMLSLLAHFTLRAFVSSSRHARASRLPLIAAAPLDVVTGTCLLVGVPPVSEESHKNFFGKAFERAAETTNAQTVMDNFDSSIVQLANVDRVRFLDAMTSLLS